MIEQQGRVIEVLPAKARIEIGPAAGCSRCAAGKGCGAGLFVRLINRRPLRLTLDCDSALHPGQVVTVGISERVFLRWVFSLYGLPLLAAFAFAIPVQYLATRAGLDSGMIDIVVLSAAIAGFALALVYLRQRTNNMVKASDLSIMNDNSLADTGQCGD